MTTKEERLQIARTIQHQLGGSRFVVMTGAKDFLALESGLQFMIPRTNNIRKVRIILQNNDLYTVEYYSVHKAEAKLRSRTEDLYADQLQDNFTLATGLYTHL